LECTGLIKTNEPSKDDQKTMRRRGLTGVATTISGDVLRVEAWTCMERPPTTRAALMSVAWASFSIMLCTCPDQQDK